MSFYICIVFTSLDKPLYTTLRGTSKKETTRKRRVVVTGLGVMSSIGHDPDVFYTNLLEGVSGISEIEGFDCSKFPSVCLLMDTYQPH